MRERLIVAAIGVPLTLAVILLAPEWLFSVLIVLLFGVCIFELIKSGRNYWYVWLIIPLITLAALSLTLYRKNFGALWTLLPVGCAYIGDAGAMLAGRFIGSHIGGGHPFPYISPKKTYAGVVGGLVVPMLFSLGLFVARGFVRHWHYALIIGLVLGAAAECGDLFFSLIKRKIGIKDYGSILPGHGGALDRFDSMIFVAPIALIGFWLLNPII
jgi:phosphatidate cytidylyltransferase